ncbi:MAG: PAS domain-containing protein, partial [Anaerolineae bacterium]|nr:PAS domain-containing protein [Anaerolineae bacterium]
MSTTPDQFVVYDRDGRISFASHSLLQGLHMSAAEIMGKTFAELGFLPPEIIAQSERERKEVFRTGQP